jgi:hypothetical protein
MYCEICDCCDAVAVKSSETHVELQLDQLYLRQSQSSKVKYARRIGTREPEILRKCLDVLSEHL